MTAHQIGLAFKGIAAGLEIGVGAVERKFAVTGFVNSVYFQREQAAFFVKEELRVIGGRLEDRLHFAQELLRFVEFGAGETCPDTVEKFGNFFVRDDGALINERAHKAGVQARLHGVEIVHEAHPERHLAVKGHGGVAHGVIVGHFVRFVVVGADGQRLAAFALEQNVETEARIIKDGLQFKHEGRAFDTAGLVSVPP